MNTWLRFVSSASRIIIGVFAIHLMSGHPIHARVLDDFDDGTLAGWEIFDFGTGNGILEEVDGTLRIGMHQAPGQQFFVAGTRTTETFTIQDGRTLEFRVDMVSANNDNDTFAVMSFIPTENSVGSLDGYSIAKDFNDVLITKGLNKYFVDYDDETLKNQNVTLVLRMTGAGESVIINAQVLDKDNRDAVIYSQTFTDTPAADPMETGDDTDGPESFAGASGRFVLLMFHNDNSGGLPASELFLDNAQVFEFESQILDDFDDGTLDDWEIFDFGTGNGNVTEADGQLTVGMFQAPGQQFFVAATKKSSTFVVRDAQTVEFSIDLIEANNPNDTFAVVAFIPTSESVSGLAGYSLSKDPNDVLIAKGLNKYFVDYDAETLKNDRVRLVLSMTGAGSSVVISGKVLDLDDGNAVLFEDTYVDSPAADPLEVGDDDPPGSYLDVPGRFVLLMFHNDTSGNLPASQVIFDNAPVTVSGGESENSAPILSGFQPVNGSIFLPADTRIRFTVQDDAGIAEENIEVTLNGAVLSTADAVEIGEGTTSREVSFGGLAANQNYVARIRVVDADGAATTLDYFFDTFDQSNLLIESEDYNFDFGLFLDEPILVPENEPASFDGYKDRVGYQDVDLSDTLSSRGDLVEHRYRTMDLTGTSRVNDLRRSKFTDAGGADAGIYDYGLRGLKPDEWVNYTRTFPEGAYEVYLRQSLFAIDRSVASLEKVLNEPDFQDQITGVLGTFLGRRSGVEFRNVPLTDGVGGEKVVIRLSGQETLRVHQVTDDPDGDYWKQNYLILIPAEAPGERPPLVARVSPLNGSVISSLNPVITATIVDRELAVAPDSIQLLVNGASAAVERSAADGVTELSHVIAPLPAPGTVHSIVLMYNDDSGASHEVAWSFTLNYLALPPEYRAGSAGSGIDPGFGVRLVQAPAGSNLANSLSRAKDQLAPNSTIPAEVSTTATPLVLNYTQNNLPSSDGYFADEATFPGIDPAVNTDDIAVEALFYLELEAGLHRLGVRSDDGYELSAGPTLASPAELILGSEGSGTADDTIDFAVATAGLYPFRLIWFERGGGAHLELFSVNRDTGERTLVRGDAADGIRAFRGVAASNEIQILSAASLGDAFSAETAQVDSDARTITVARPEGTRFFRLRAGTALRIVGVTVQETQLVFTFE